MPRRYKYVPMQMYPAFGPPGGFPQPMHGGQNKKLDKAINALSPLAYYKFIPPNQLVDSSGSGNDLTSSTASSAVGPKDYSAVVANGEYLESTDASFLNLLGTTTATQASSWLTVVAMIKPTDVSTQIFINNKGDRQTGSPGAYGWQWQVTSAGELRFDLGRPSSSGTSVSTSGAGITAGNWYFVAARMQGSLVSTGGQGYFTVNDQHWYGRTNLTFGANGSLVNKSSDNIYNTEIGRVWNNGAFSYGNDFSMEYLAIYDYQLSDANIDNLYAKTLPYL